MPSCARASLALIAGGGFLTGMLRSTIPLIWLQLGQTTRFIFFLARAVSCDNCALRKRLCVATKALRYLPPGLGGQFREMPQIGGANGRQGR